MKEAETLAAATVDTRDMVVVHTALLREIRRAPAAVERAAAGRSRRRRARTVRHLRLILDLLEHHHAGEDRLMLPLLRGRISRDELPAVDTGEEQHARIEGLLGDIGGALARWSGGDHGAAPGLAAMLTALHGALEPHLRGEETDILPLVATHLSVAEWQAVGDAGFRATPKSALVLVFGMFMAEGDPEVLRSMLAAAPAPARVLLPRIAPAVYARRCRAVHGLDPAAGRTAKDA